MPPKRKTKKKESRPPTPEPVEVIEEDKTDYAFLDVLHSMHSVEASSVHIKTIMDKVNNTITDKWVKTELPAHNSKRERAVQRNMLN